MARKLVATLSLSLTLTFTLSLPARADAQTSAPKRPRLVVLISVDQMRQDYLDRWADQLTGGFKRLREQGAYFTNAYQDHAVTETAIGHSALLSGRFPRSIGIITNNAGIQDPQAPLVGGGPGASPFRFRGTTLTDWMRIADPGTRALSVSAKDRAAILMQGRGKQNVFWYYNGRFTTSTYYGDTLPTWVSAFNAQRIPQSYAGRSWTLLLDPSKYAEPDSVPVENRGRNITFPHLLPTDSTLAANGLMNYPFMDEVLVRLALAGVDALKLGQSGHPDVLSVSLSPTDYIGHAFGPESREIHDQILRLDRTLGAFFDSLATRFQSDQLAIVLTADHGVTPFPQLHLKNPATPPGVDIRPAVAETRAYLRSRGIADTTALTADAGMLILSPEKLNFDRVLMDSVAHVFARAARKVDGVARVQFVKDLATSDTLHNAVTRRWLHMIPPDLPVPVVVTTVPTRVWGTAVGAAHGSPYDVDAHVPLVFYGPWFKAGRYARFARTVDIAPTLAEILHVVPTEKLDGKSLREAIK